MRFSRILLLQLLSPQVNALIGNDKISLLRKSGAEKGEHRTHSKVCKNVPAIVPSVLQLTGHLKRPAGTKEADASQEPC